MSFQTFGYFAFLVILVVLAVRVENRLLRKSAFLAASLYFYSTFGYLFLGVLLLEAVYFQACAIFLSSHREHGRRTLIKVGMVSIPLLVLAFYKFSGPFLLEINAALVSIGLNPDSAALVAPVGISFFTFQGIAYFLDVDKDRSKPLKSWLDVLLYFSFFPHVLSGPIARVTELGPQIEGAGHVTHNRFREGVFLLARGYAKKILFADPVATHIVNPAFANPGSMSSLDLVLGLLGYTLQIYMDLSGYTDIVRGSAKVIGFDLAENFNRPYSALTVSQFWQRWHQSMSGFFRDYLFHAVGGSRNGNVYVNLLLTFIAIGLWHGAGWNFVLYGLLHGAVVGYERYRRGKRKSAGLPELDPRMVFTIKAWAFTFAFVVFSRLLFRSPDLSSAVQYLIAMIHNIHINMTMNWMAIWMLAGIVLSVTPHRLSRRMVVFYARIGVWPAAALAAVVSLGLLGLNAGAGGFIYFRF